MTINTAIQPSRRLLLDGLLLSLACLIAAGGFLVHPIRWLTAAL